MWGFILGLILGNTYKIPDNQKAGIDYTASKLLEVSIIFLAFSINYTHLAQIGWQSIATVAIVITIVLLTTIYLSNKLNCKDSTGWLVGFGTAICGSSAIAALSPTVTKDKADIGISMAIVNILGSIGMISMPFLFEFLQLSTMDAGLIIGASLHSVGNVAGAGYAMNNEVGQAAIAIKLARVALLSPALIFFNLLVSRKEVSSFKVHLKLPWYLWVFIGITILTSMVNLPDFIIDKAEWLGKITLTTAMVALGLKVNFKTVFNAGKTGLIFGVMIFAVQLVAIILFMNLL